MRIGGSRTRTPVACEHQRAWHGDFDRTLHMACANRSQPGMRPGKKLASEARSNERRNNLDRLGRFREDPKGWRVPRGFRSDFSGTLARMNATNRRKFMSQCAGLAARGRTLPL